MTRRSPFLIFFLAFVSAIFIGILIFVYIVTKQTNPVMLDDKGRPVSSASGAGSQPAAASQAASAAARWGAVENTLEGGQSWPQPPFRRPEPAESRLRAELPALRPA